MQDTDIAEGPQQTAKGLHHAYGIHAISKGVPVTSVQKWLGHAQLSTTAIYVDFVGAEASDLTARMWSRLHDEESNRIAVISSTIRNYCKCCAVSL